MKIGIRGGHSPNCKGAIGLRDEQSCMRTLSYEVMKILRENGHIVIDCNNNANTQNAELSEGAKIANNNNVELFISLHMNSFNGQAQGTESLVAIGCRQWGKDIAKRLCDNFATLGLVNRGVKEKNLYEMKNINALNIIFETMFCDNSHDINEIWSPTPYEKMALLIANAIDPKIKINSKYKVVIQYFTKKEDAEKVQKELSKKWYCFVEEVN